MNQKKCAMCGTLVDINANFCIKCRSTKFLQLNNKKKTKAPIIILLSVLGVVILVVGVILLGKVISGTFGSESIVEEAETVSFDLSEYDSYGTVSCGRIWVERTTEGSYNESEESEFAYFDVDGNQISEWFSSSNWNQHDFSNDYVVITQEHVFISNDNGSVNSELTETLVCKVYDKDFNLLVTIECDKDETGSSSNDYYNYPLITDANEDGDIFAIGTIDGSYGLFVINDGDITELEMDDLELNYVATKDLMNIEKQQGYYVVDFHYHDVIGNLPKDVAVYDSNGNEVIDIDDVVSYQVYSVDVISDNEFEIMFGGDDGSYYTVTIDRNGNFLTEPILE